MIPNKKVGPSCTAFTALRGNSAYLWLFIFAREVGLLDPFRLTDSGKHRILTLIITLAVYSTRVNDNNIVFLTKRLTRVNETRSM